MASKAAEKQRFGDKRLKTGPLIPDALNKFLEKHYMRGVYRNTGGLVLFLSIQQAWFQLGSGQ